jgi:iron uptake system EfeUOB component EfeO/EfeM
MTYGFPFKLIKSNLNFNLSYNFSKSPGLVNDVLNKADNSSYALGVTLASNISPTVDFTLTSRTSFNSVKNSIQTRSNSEYWNQNSRFRINWIILEGFVLRTDLSHQYYNGLSETFGQNYLLWNLGIGKKVLKNDRGELTLSVNDLLKQNRNVSRIVTETYFEDVRTNDLTQYVMLTFTYNLRKFKIGSEPEKEQHNWPGGVRPPFMPH